MAIRFEVPETHYARGGGVNIAWQAAGEGPFDLVLVPGWVSNVEFAREEPSPARFYRSLTAFARLILFDKRWTGLSDRGGEIPAFEKRMDDVRAVRCAQAIAAALAPLGLAIRAGAHPSECEVIGRDVAGFTVHIAARVGAQAGAGEVWVSEAVKDLLPGSGIALDERGEHALKGIPGRWKLFAARAEG